MSSRFVQINCEKLFLSIYFSIPIRVNFATVKDFQRISHVGSKIACAVIALETLQTFLSAMFDAATLAMLDFSRDVGFFGFEGEMWDLIA